MNKVLIGECFLACAWTAAALAQAFIVEDGAAQAEIVVSPECPPIVTLAAADLARYVEKLSGATLPVGHAPSETVPVQVYVGRSEYTDRLGLRVDDLEHGAFRMATGEHWLALLGRDREWEPDGLMALAADKRAWVDSAQSRSEDHPLWAAWDRAADEHFGLPFSQLWKQYNRELDLWEMDERGTFNAVAAFLRLQGVRWYMPGDLGEVVPRRTSIALPEIDRTVRPDFPLRYPYIYGHRFATSVTNVMWQLRMGFSQAVDVIGPGYRAHGIAHVIGRDETKRAHPEYYALLDGRRVTEDRFARHGRPCLSSPELIAANVRFVRAMFDTFDMPMVSVMPVDGFTRICQCERCQGKAEPDRGWRGQFSNYVWEYCERVAAEVHKTHPDRKVVGMAYTTYMLPPTNIDRFSPNLVIAIAQHRCGFTQNPDEREFFRILRRDWLAKLGGDERQLYQYEYYRYAVPGNPGQFTPAFFPHAIAADLAALKDISLGDTIEVYHGLRGAVDARVITELNLYVTGRCWWDAKLDVDALLDEYCSLFYGPAADPMRAFINDAEMTWMELKTPGAIDRLFALLQAARAAAPDGSVYARRIQLVADYMKPLHDLRRQLARPRDNVPRATLITRDDVAVTVDGRLDEPVWSQLRVNHLRDVKSGHRPPIRTRFHVFWAQESLFVGIVCEEPDMPGLTVADRTDDDTAIWDGDEVEILLETQVHAYYQLCISPAGNVTDVDHAAGMNTLWDAQAEVGVHRGDDVWTVEVRIPVVDPNQADVDPNHGIAGRMPSNAYPWYINVCRQRVRGETRQHWAFSPTGAGFQEPRKFAEMGGIIRDAAERERRRQLRQEWLQQWE